MEKKLYTTANGMLTETCVLNAFKENNFEDTTFICPDGAEAVVAPCCYYGEKSIENCEYFLIYWDMPWGGEDTLEKLVKTLNRHEELAAEQEEDKIKIRKYFDKHQANGWDDESWSFYSDWHKDIYGYRPHGRVCGEYVRPW